MLRLDYARPLTFADYRRIARSLIVGILLIANPHYAVRGAPKLVSEQIRAINHICINNFGTQLDLKNIVFEALEQST